MDVGVKDKEFAGFGIRLLANVIDGVVLAVPLLVFNVLVMLPMFGLSLTTGMDPVGFLPLILSFVNSLVSVFYLVIMPCTKYQGTVGKMILGLKIVGDDGGRITFGRSVGRYFGQVLSGLIFYIGYLMVLFTPEKRALHDYVAATYVVKK